MSQGRKVGQELLLVGERDMSEHAKRAASGSSWAALLVAIATKPANLPALLITCGIKKGRAGFDACADAWAIYTDGLANGADL